MEPDALSLDRNEPARRWLSFCCYSALIVVALILAAMLWLQLLRASKVVYGEMRGAPSLALLSHERIYQGPDVAGPLFCVVYPPLTYPLYAAIGLWKRPESVLLAGSVMAFALYSLPLFYILLRFRKEARRTAAAAAAMPLLFLAFTLCSAPLAYSGTYLHADAPALGFSGMAGSILYFHHGSEKRRHPILCALFTVLALGAKQSALPLLVVIPLLALYLGNRAFSVCYLVSAGVFGLLSAGVAVLVYHGASFIVFNAWTIPSRLPFVWIKAPVAMSVLHEASLPLLFTVITMALVAAALRLRLSRSDLLPLTILPILGLALLPFSLLAMTLFGGDQNALSPPIYFTLLSVIALVYSSTVNALPVARFWAAASLITAGLLVPVTLRAMRPPLLKQALTPGSSETVFEYARRHPGEVYFPDHQLSVYLAEGRFYHSDWGVGDYILGGIRPSREVILAHIPPLARYVAYPLSPPGEWLLPYLAPHRKAHAIQELPEFEVFEIER